ncbi:MAG: hypothetical protein CMF36_16145 [Leeuwenhoekiella sp.]|nr:hypothetical protein [Leeuwenhoekiella sp.]MBA82661.1 hypothetical protein [Leeuwenhoekiella sp.]|tara:strand:+ start:39229 stop:39633 length:405 start_codon:yes stop_codon:yes gene_type:complete
MISLKYRKRKRYLNLTLGLLWIIILVFRIGLNQKLEAFDFWIIGFALFFILYFIYLTKWPVITLSETQIIRHRFLGDKILFINDLVEFKVNAKGDYVLKSNSGNTICFKPVYLDKKSLGVFKKYLAVLISERKL